ncbi:hypothetical protein EVAR_50044_1 [Eumeta japonica]|uniref:Uncharacterized protein n=1 Tax=Eumeta variegata TaxID=151549 RepID=A0A4C1XI52_EUMVA|nr:hypothetical protein EVAR_50044_1 [Eumeta japonica]
MNQSLFADLGRDLNSTRSIKPPAHGYLKRHHNTNDQKRLKEKICNRFSDHNAHELLENWDKLKTEPGSKENVGRELEIIVKSVSKSETEAGPESKTRTRLGSTAKSNQQQI